MKCDKCVHGLTEMERGTASSLTPARPFRREAARRKMPFRALKGLMPLNISELFKESDIQTAHVLPQLPFAPSRGGSLGQAERDLGKVRI